MRGKGPGHADGLILNSRFVKSITMHPAGRSLRSVSRALVCTGLLVAHSEFGEENGANGITAVYAFDART